MPRRLTLPLVVPTVIGLLAGRCNEPAPASSDSVLTQPVEPPQPPDIGNHVDREITIHVYTTDNLRNHCVGPEGTICVASSTCGLSAINPCVRLELMTLDRGYYYVSLADLEQKVRPLREGIKAAAACARELE